MNEHFLLFLEEFGEGTDQEAPDDAFFEQYQSIMPASYISFIRNQGFASYGGGLFWTVHPARLSGYARNWLSPIGQLAGKEYFVFARSAFGDLYVLQADSGHQLSISTATGVIWASKKIAAPSRNFSLGIESFFGSAYRKDFDIEDDDGHSMFSHAHEKFGPLTPNEVYGFAPGLSAGGHISSESLCRARLDAHLDLLTQLTSPSLRLV
jgi:hypothetical protein